MTLAAEILVAALLVLGGSFLLVGSWGLAKLPSLMTRLHGPTKATTLGVGACLVASMIYFPVFGGNASAHELLITLFLLLTAPVSANMIARATASTPTPPTASPAACRRRRRATGPPSAAQTATRRERRRRADARLAPAN